MKIETGTNYDTDYGPIKGLLEMPAAVAPGDGSLEATGKINLVAANIRDRRHTDSQYVFEIEDAAGTKEVSPPIPAGDQQTKWSPKMELKAGAHYAWRVGPSRAIGKVRCAARSLSSKDEPNSGEEQK